MIQKMRRLRTAAFMTLLSFMATTLPAAALVSTWTFNNADLLDTRSGLATFSISGGFDCEVGDTFFGVPRANITVTDLTGESGAVTFTETDLEGPLRGSNLRFAGGTGGIVTNIVLDLYFDPDLTGAGNSAALTGTYAYDFPLCLPGRGGGLDCPDPFDPGDVFAFSAFGVSGPSAVNLSGATSLGCIVNNQDRCFDIAPGATVTAEPIPLPPALAMFGLGLAALGALRFRVRAA